MMHYVMLALGLALLVKGADFLVDGASDLAKKFGISSLVIGMTVVAFGTSLPELVVSMLSAFQGSTELALGNIVGSNISNILLILGAIAIFRSLKIEKSTIWKGIPFSLLAAVVLFMAANDMIIDQIMPSAITRIDGLIMLVFFIIFMYYSFEMMRREKKNNNTEGTKKIKLGKITGLIAIGLVFLFIGGKWTVDNAVLIAHDLGITEFLMSATVIALGTSLPELATGVIAAFKKKADLAIGNIIGSNIFNIFFILSATAIIHPIPLPAFANFDLIWLIFVNVLLFFFVFREKHHTLERKEAVILLFLYITYIFILIGRG